MIERKWTIHNLALALSNYILTSLSAAPSTIAALSRMNHAELPGSIICRWRQIEEPEYLEKNVFREISICSKFAQWLTNQFFFGNIIIICSGSSPLYLFEIHSTLSNCLTSQQVHNIPCRRLRRSRGRRRPKLFENTHPCRWTSTPPANCVLFCCYTESGWSSISQLT